MTQHDRWSRWGAVPLRWTIGPMFLVHGAGKLFGVFGGSGLGPLADHLVAMGFSPGVFWALLVGGAEFVGGGCLVVGWFTRLAVWPLVVVMGVAIGKVHGPHGFFLRDGGFEYPFVILGGLLALMVLGGGPGSLDARRGRRPPATTPVESGQGGTP